MRRTLVPLLAAAAALTAGAAPAAAALTATRGAGTATLTGGDGAEAVTLSAAGNVLLHGRASAQEPLFASDADWDTGVPGVQEVTLDGSYDVAVALGGGADGFAGTVAGLKSLTVDGGAGDDVLNGTPAADQLRGGDGNDVLMPGPGADTAAGGDGDDTLVWANGHGSDRLDGDGGEDRVLVTGAPTGETFTVSAAGDRTTLAREAPGAFTLDLASEAAELQTRDGDDVVTATGAVPVTVRSGAGNDVLRGGDADDLLDGGAGTDQLTGGGGTDLLDAGPGDDTLAARDGAPDLVRCGAGTDAATLDAVGVDTGSACEGLDQPAAPVQTTTVTVTNTVTVPVPAPVRATVPAGQRLKPLRGVVRLTLRCPAGGRACTGRVELGTATPVTAARTRITGRLAAAAFSVPAGTRRTVALRLPSGYASLARRRAATLRLLATVLPAGGAPGPRTPVTIRLR